MKQTQKSRVAMHEDPYTYFSPDAEFYNEQVTPIAARATPYTSPPQECSINLKTGIIQCMNQESFGELRTIPQFKGSCPVSHKIAEALSTTNNFGSGQDDMPLTHHFGRTYPTDSPLNRILTRQPVGPWKLIGNVITTNPNSSESRDRTMLVYVQSQDTARDRYNYRVVDSNNVPLEVYTNVRWKSGGETFQIPGQSYPYTLYLYSPYNDY